MSQTAYAVLPAVAVPGMLVDNRDRTVLSRIADVAMPAGVLAVRGGADGRGKLPTVVGDVAPANALGVTLYDATKEPGVYAAAYDVPLLREGCVWVQVEEAVNGGDPAFVRYAAGAGGTQLGAFRKSADTATASALAGCRYLTAAGIAGFAQLEINLPT